MKATIKVLPASEIERLYPSHWILLSPFKYTKAGKLLRGRVISAHDNKPEMYDALDKMTESPWAIHVTRKPDPNRNHWWHFQVLPRESVQS